ncbi:MAG: hypothetical protein IJW30_04765 [Clostridia bacterium]|nr:hypothetical protein [Clostridia bacterium]
MKSTTFKKLMSLLLVLAMALTLVFATSCSKKDEDDDDDDKKTEDGPSVDAEEGRDEFISELGGVSDTYAGAVSEESFATAEEAAEAYVAEEVVGDSYATITNTTSKGELNDTQIDLLNIPEELSDGIVAVEELEVEYTLAESTAYTANGNEIEACDTLNTSKKVRVYVIKYENDWKYFTPCPVNGETISKSYYDSVFDNDKYRNCTLTTTMTLYADMKGNAAGQSLDGGLEVTMNQTIKHDGKKVFIEQVMTIKGTGAYAGQEDMMASSFGDEYLCAYMEEVTNEYGYPETVCYIKDSATATEWYEGELYQIGFSKIEELTPFYNQYLDYTYFTKTEFGFALADENAQKYIEQAMAQLTNLLTGDDWDFDLYAEYYVCDGVLSGMRNNAEVALDMTQSYGGQTMTMSMFETLQQTITVTDYGTTVVENPIAD